MLMQNVFEEDGTEVTVTEAILTDDGAKVVFKKDYKGEVVTGRSLPHKDFSRAVARLAPIVARRLDEGVLRFGKNDGMMPVGAVMDVDGFGDSYVQVVVEIALPGLGIKVRKATKRLTVKSEFWWGLKDNEGRPVNVPDEQPENCSPSEQALVEDVMLEAYLYACRAKLEKYEDQPDLPFDTPSADGSGEAGQEASK